MDTVISLLLLSLALSVIALFVSLVLKSFSFNFHLGSFLRARHHKNLERHLEIIDGHLTDNRIHDALSELNKSFLVGVTACAPFAPNSALEHNLSCLERIVQISHKRKLSAENLGELERLFDEQTRLITAYREVSLKYKRLKRKDRWQIRKKAQWAHEEFSKKLEELTDKLKGNSTETTTQLRHLLSSLEGLPEQKEVTLH